MTRIAGLNIIKTPCCGALLSTTGYASINFMAFEYWTDGHDDGFLAPKGEGLRRCSCGRVFLIGDAECVKTIQTTKPIAPTGWESRKGNWWTRLMGRESREEIVARYETRPLAVIDAEERSIPPRTRQVLDLELQEVIDSGANDVRVEEVARRLYWRYLNEPFRVIYRTFREAQNEDAEEAGMYSTYLAYWPSAGQIQNMERLVKLLEAVDGPNWLEAAELYRELGEMEAATQALNRIAGSKQRLHSIVEALVERNVRCPVAFSY